MLIKKAYQAYRREGLSYVLSNGVNLLRNNIADAIHNIQYIDDYCYEESISRLENHMEREKSHGDVLDTVYNYEGIGKYETIRPIHAIPNARALLNKVNEHEPEVIVEIGAGHGGSLYMWSRGVDSAKLIVSIDIGFLTGKRLLESYNSDAEVHVLQANSHSENTVKQLQEILGGRKIDFLYIDGDHSYEGVIQDFEMYTPLVGEGGIVILDDVDNTISAPEVPKAWNQIKENNDAYTFKESDKSSAQGVVQL